MKYRLRLTLGVLLLASSGAYAQSDRKPADAAARGWPGSMQNEPPQRMQGKKLSWDHEIQVALPKSYGEQDRRFPVFWVTDGNANFSSALQALRVLGSHVPEMILVGVGPPPNAAHEFQTRRAYEFGAAGDWGRTNAPGKDVYLKAAAALNEATSKAGLGTAHKSGGARDFLSFIVDEVRPALSRQYRFGDTHILFGHSGGGTFCTFALLERPESFQKYICSSASLYGGDTILFDLENRYAAAHDDLKADVFFDAGEAEILQNIMAGLGVVSSTVRMAEVLAARNYPSLNLSMRIFPAEDHGSVVPLALYWGLRTVWKSDSRPQE